MEQAARVVRPRDAQRQQGVRAEEEDAAPGQAQDGALAHAGRLRRGGRGAPVRAFGAGRQGSHVPKDAAAIVPQQPHGHGLGQKTRQVQPLGGAGGEGEAGGGHGACVGVCACVCVCVRACLGQRRLGQRRLREGVSRADGVFFFSRAATRVRTSRLHTCSPK